MVGLKICTITFKWKEEKEKKDIFLAEGFDEVEKCFPGRRIKMRAVLPKYGIHLRHNDV